MIREPIPRAVLQSHTPSRFVSLVNSRYRRIHCCSVLYSYASWGLRAVIIILCAMLLSRPDVWMAAGIMGLDAYLQKWIALSYLSLISEGNELQNLILRVVVTRVVSHFREDYLRHISICSSLLALVMGLKGIRAPAPGATDPERFQIASGNLHHISGSFGASLETRRLINLAGSGTLTLAHRFLAWLDRIRRFNRVPDVLITAPDVGPC